MSNSNIRAERTYYKRKKAGLCVLCGRPRGDNGTFTRCRQCADVQCSSAKNRSILRYNVGLCSCGDATLPNKRACEYCSLKRTAFNRLGVTGKLVIDSLKLQLATQNYECYYSGIPLIIGKNATLDHKRPVSRFPDDKTKLNNIVWCDSQINEMKNNLTPEEFIEMCAKVLKYNGWMVTPPDKAK